MYTFISYLTPCVMLDHSKYQIWPNMGHYDHVYLWYMPNLDRFKKLIIFQF